MAWKLRQDDRVVSMEKTNIRYLTRENIEDEVTFVSVDVSFISLTKVLSPVKELMANEGEVVCLIKPQFEAGREKVGKKGVVKDKKIHMEVIHMISSYASEIGFDCLGLDYSPIKGPEGNIEYLLYLRKTPGSGIKKDEIEAVVNNAHEQLNIRNKNDCLNFKILYDTLLTIIRSVKHGQFFSHNE